jgi:hypothetical protein
MTRLPPKQRDRYFLGALFRLAHPAFLPFVLPCLARRKQGVRSTCRYAFFCALKRERSYCSGVSLKVGNVVLHRKTSCAAAATPAQSMRTGRETSSEPRDRVELVAAIQALVRLPQSLSRSAMDLWQWALRHELGTAPYYHELNISLEVPSTPRGCARVNGTSKFLRADSGRIPVPTLQFCFKPIRSLHYLGSLRQPWVSTSRRELHILPVESAAY